MVGCGWADIYIYIPSAVRPSTLLSVFVRLFLILVAKQIKATFFDLDFKYKCNFLGVDGRTWTALYIFSRPSIYIHGRFY